MIIPRLGLSLDRSVYYSIGEEPEIRSIPNAMEKNIANLFSDIFDNIRKIDYPTCEGIEVTFIEYFYDSSAREFDILLPEEDSRVMSFIRPDSISHARSIRFADIGKRVAPLRIIVLFPI